MIRSLVVALALSTLLGTCFAASASAYAYLTIVPKSIGPTMERVQINPQISYSPGQCESGYTYCNPSTGTLRVTPCPSGLPCTNGAYEVTFDTYFGPFPYVDLDLDRTYTFNLHVVKESGNPTLPCVYTCRYEFDLPAVQYTTQPSASIPSWDVSPVSSNEDTLWVDIGYANVVPTPCVDNCRTWREAGFYITPCPLWPPRTCEANSVFLDNYVEHPTRVGLHVNTSYTLSGGIYTTVFRRESTGACVEPDCSYLQKPPDKTFTAAATATTPITWGAVKAMYRSP